MVDCSLKNLHEKSHFPVLLDHINDGLITTNPVFVSNSTFIFSYFLFAFCLFFIGISGVFLNERSLLHVFIFFEITFLGSILLFIGLGVFFALKEAFVIALLLLAISAVELSLALTFIVAFFKVNKKISVFVLKKLKK